VSTIVIMMASIIIEKEKSINKKISFEIKKALERNKQQELELYKKKRYKILSEFVSVIAHHWRQPLNNISLLSQMLVLHYKQNKLNDEFISYYKNHINEEIQEVSKKIEIFKNYIIEDNERVFELNKLFEDLLELFFPMYNLLNKNINFICDSKKIFIKGKRNDFMLIILIILDSLFKTEQKEDVILQCTTDHK